MKRPFHIDGSLARLSENDQITHRQAMQANIGFGGVGSGKSVGLGETFLRAYMRNGYGMCCLTVKPEETEEIETLARETGRQEDLIKISPESGWNHDPFKTENNRGIGSETQTIVSLFGNLVEIANGKQTSSESYWQNAQNTLMTAVVLALKCANEPVSIENIYNCIVTAPTSEKVLSSTEFRDSSYCYQILERAVKNVDTAEGQDGEITHYRDFDFAWPYWSKEFPKLAEKTRSIIVSTLTSTASQFLTGSLRTVFSETDTRRPCPPELARAGKIIIVDMSVKVYESVGVMANNLYKLLFQKAMERVPLKVSGVPVALYADECQHFVNDYDNLFLQTSRSAGCSVFFLTQSINNLITKYGQNGEAAAYNLLGLITNKFAMRNTCVKTNQYFAELIGQDWDLQSSSSVNMGDGDENITSSLHEQRRYLVEPIRFTELLTDGDNLIFEAIVHNGREWSNGEKFLRCYFQKQ